LKEGGLIWEGFDVDFDVLCRTNTENKD